MIKTARQEGGAISESYFIAQWKQRMWQVIKTRYADHPLDKKKVMRFLDKKIEKHLYNPQMLIANNYTNQIIKTDLLALIDLIENNQLIVGADGCLFVQHSVKDNVMIGYILWLMDERNRHKALRKKFDDSSFEYLMEDIMQGSVKVAINQLYGVQGSRGFLLYNRFLAESITTMGRHIICTAVNCFEKFLSGNITFSNDTELYCWLSIIHSEYKKNYKDTLDISSFECPIDDNHLLSHIEGKCGFRVSDNLRGNLLGMFRNLDRAEKVLLYYKDNIREFNQIPFIKEHWLFIMNNIEELLSFDISKLDSGVQKAINDILKLYQIFVIVDYPTFDRLRKAMYMDHETVLYVDTDSNFLGLNRHVQYVKRDVMQGNYHVDEKMTEMISVNIITNLLSPIIKTALLTMAKGMNVTDEYADYLNMKNEFFNSRIVFGSGTKKRYFSNVILQEGKILGGGLGKIDIKGFDFKKSTTKNFVRDYYTDICQNDILRSDTIDVIAIYEKIYQLKLDIEDSIKRGESDYLKQANVKLIEHYKRPYQTQGVTSCLLWNTLCPEYQIELPGDVDILPILDLTWPKETANAKMKPLDGIKNIQWFASTYPYQYELLYKYIYMNDNPLIRHMSIKNIAKPKNANVPIPEWLKAIIDHEKIIMNTINMFIPIMRSLGLKDIQVDSTTSYMSNMIEL